ncbi:hypothetical protein RSJ8_1423 [Clostridium botulinum]|nr:hypothetical protein NPD1_3297 [Clostridium botulinum]APQ69609.1 hypothetical protein RSJ8_1423 [Clostridium botulinum]
MNILNLLMYMDITILGSVIIVVAMQNKELNKKCNEIINK